MFSESFLAWQNEPMKINVGDPNVPVRRLDYPAVTVCQDEEDDTVDRWYFIEALLNVVDVQCRKGKKEPIIFPIALDRKRPNPNVRKSVDFLHKMSVFSAF